jgi:hypothetical protein
MREVWAAQVRGDGGRFEMARLEVDDAGRFRLSTRSAAAGSDDVAVLERGDVVRLYEVLDDELGSGA